MLSQVALGQRRIKLAMLMVHQQRRSDLHEVPKCRVGDFVTPRRVDLAQTARALESAYVCQ